MPKSTPSSSPASGARKRLGRGLSSLLNTPVKVDMPDQAAHRSTAADVPRAAPSSTPSEVEHASDQNGAQLQLVQTSRIEPNQFQPRRSFEQTALEGLAASIREAGMMQPIVVRPGQQEGWYELIAGERRWRAATMLGLSHIPAVVRDVDGQTAAQWALVENLQREDLNAVERAEAFRRLAGEFQLTHQEIADRVGLDRTSVTNHLRLLDLDQEILDLVAAGGLSMGHARALLVITNTRRRRLFALRAAKEAWSVRELERRARSLENPQSQTSQQARTGLPAHLQDLQRRLGEHLGCKVDIQPGKKKGAGKLVIEFYSLDEFEGLLDRLQFVPS